MRASASMAELLIAFHGPLEVRQPFAIGGGTRVVAQFQVGLGQPMLDQLFPDRGQGGDEGRACLVNLASSLCQGLEPGASLAQVTVAQCGVALAERMLVSQCRIAVTRFHMERPPVQKLSPHPRPIKQQPLVFGIDQLNRKSGGQLRPTGGITPVEPEGGSARASGYCQAILPAQSDHPRLPGLPAHDSIQGSCTEGSNPGQKVDRLKQASLPCTVGPHQDVQAWVRMKTQGLEVAEALTLELMHRPRDA